MEKQKRVSHFSEEYKQNRREELNAAIAKCHIRIGKYEQEIAALDAQPKPRTRKPTLKKVLESAKDDFDAEEMLAILEAAREQKRLMRAE